MNEIDEFESLERLDEIRGLLDEMNIKYEVHRRNEGEFSYLAEGEASVKIVNPYVDDENRTVFIDLQDEISLFFGAEWHGHYYSDEEDFREFREDLCGLMRNELCGAAVFIGDDLRWGGSMLTDRESVEGKSAEMIFAGGNPDDAGEFRQAWEEKGAEIRFRFWNPKFDKTVVIGKRAV